jgi:hypothetical protein
MNQGKWITAIVVASVALTGVLATARAAHSRIDESGSMAAGKDGGGDGGGASFARAVADGGVGQSSAASGDN